MSRRGEPIDFDPGTIPLPARHQEHRRLSAAPRHGLGGPVRRVAKARSAWSPRRTLRLLPAPKAVLAGVVFFPGDDAAVDAVEAWRDAPRRACWSISTRPRSSCCARAFPRFPAAARAAILFEQELQSEDDPEVDALAGAHRGAGALAEDSWFATTAADRERFRRFRHALPELVNDTVRRSGAMKMNTDYAVPLARNREMLAYYRAAPGSGVPRPVRDLRPHRRRARPHQPVQRSRPIRNTPPHC